MAVVPKRIVVMGAGPKALSLAGKMKALEAADVPVPEVVIVEAAGVVAANWDGNQGYTDGRQPLGTPPEKDVGFPYASNCWGEQSEQINGWMLRLSWQAYLTSNASGRLIPYADWVDRGKPHPGHGEWAKYLRWVFEQTKPDLRHATLESIGISSDRARWSLGLRDSHGAGSEIEADGLVLTGPGDPKPLCAEQPESPRLFDGGTYWRNIHTFSTAEQPLNVCVVGTGETAASVVVSLLATLPPTSLVDIISSQGVVYSRGESYDENRFYTDPGYWAAMSEAHRLEFIKRTDRAVFSVHAKAIANAAPNLRTILGRVDEINEVAEVLELKIAYDRGAGNHETVVKPYDYVVAAAGFDPASFTKMLTPEARNALEKRLVAEPTQILDPHRLQWQVEEDLALGTGPPRLHVPMLAGLMHGPGFPNLSSLGRLSDRILRPYVTI